MKPKEWLVKNGHLEKVGRGRLSASHIELIKGAVANGENIEGYAVSTPVVKETVQSVDKPSTAPEVKRITVEAGRILDVPDQIRDERGFTAHVTVNGKTTEIGKRQACNVCGNSLTYCFCGTPTVWVDFDTEALVTFKSTGWKEPE